MKNTVLNTCLSVVVLHLCFASLANSLWCYQCDSLEDIRCGEDLISRDLRALPCDTLSDPKYCVKMTGVFGAESLKCYQCSSETEYTCGEFFHAGSTDVPLTECPMANAKFCAKTTGIFSGNLGAKRFCSERFLDNYCTYVQRPGDQREYRSCVYTCTGDGCNGSAGLNPAKLIQISAMLLPLFAVVTYRRF